MNDRGYRRPIPTYLPFPDLAPTRQNGRRQSNMSPKSLYPPFNPNEIYPVREDTCLLLDLAMKEAHPSDRVIEVGTGSGYIAQQLHRKVALMVATDINPHAVLAVGEKGIDVIRTDLLAGVCGSFTLVLFNPPYLPTRPEDRISDWLEYALDGGFTGRDVIVRFSKQVSRVLSRQGRILLLASSLTGKKQIQDIFKQRGFDGKIVAEKIIEDEELFVYRFQRTPESV